MKINEISNKDETNEYELDNFTVVSDSCFNINPLKNLDFNSFICESTNEKLLYMSKYSIDKNNKEFFSDKNILSKKFYLNENKSEINNFKGSLITLLAVLIFSFNNLIGKILGFYYPEVENAITNLIRGITITLLSVVIMKNKQINILEFLQSKPKQKTNILLLRCFCGSIANFLLLESLRHLRVSSAFTIFSLAPILTGFLSAFFLKSKFGKLDILAFFVCFFSVVLITKPDFIYASKENEIANNKNEDEKIGIFLCLLGAGFSGVSIFFNKIISKDFEDELTTFFLGIFFILEALVVIPFTKNCFSTVSLLSVLLAVLIAVFYYVHVSLFIVAIRISNPIKILPLSYFGVVLTLGYNTFIFKQYCDLLDILGSFLITFVNIYKICNQKNE